ncbi:hypothetical protein GWI33_013612 [Rhynchophorus ferrugineus]|uniref:DNA helicase MCM8 n=1 Tax=Rhynchophorus ferrugineus TaxID=354439 RepID=A0A834I3C9_RHYFE|nr:hypothetical protein GWI33_013612 [Rhynchophorus ferrugineus]
MDLYFMNVEEEHLKTISCQVESFQAHIKRNSPVYSLQQIEKDHFFTLDYKKVIDDTDFVADWPEFIKDLTCNTEFVLNCLGLAMHDYISQTKNTSESAQDSQKKILLIRARILNFEPVLQLRDVNVNCFGKFVSLRGTVIKAGTVKIVCTAMPFYCESCKTTQLVKQTNGIYTPLEKCQTSGCRMKGHFECVYDSPLAKTIYWQSVVIQENDSLVVPQTLECELTEDLVNSCSPGDDVTISGVVKVRDPNHNKECEGSNLQDILNFTPEDYYSIKQIHSRPNLFPYLVNSLCPTIYGHEIIKAGLVLALFRGTKSNTSRAESHVLLVGDPGLGKSQMLKSCSNVSPRGVYVCGSGSTTSGLTVTMTRENGGEYALEAGALMLADQGCCCIDEFDKMPAQHAGLLEAMEQQCISIAKAGVICSLPTKPTILVAANPAGGHYNKSKTISENLKMGSPMLSRFDLTFILLDKPDEDFDEYLSKNILASHSSSSKKRRFVSKNVAANLNHTVREGVDTLRNRLRNCGTELDPLPHKAFRKYIAYALKYVNPQLSDGAKAILIDFYVSLRKQFASGDSTPVTARQLYSLIRLTQARAKTELREEATEQDALDVVEIMKHSIVDVFTNETGMLDVTRSQMGTGMSYKNQVMRLVEVLQRKSEIESKSLFTLQEIKEASESAGILKTKFTNALQSLNIQGFLLNKGMNMYQLNSAYL